jgi:hypothetical protein
MSPMLIDKVCGQIGASFLKMVNQSVILEDESSMIHGAHRLVRGDLTFNAIAERNRTGRPEYVYHLGAALALFDVSMTLAASPEFCPEVAFDADSIIAYRAITPSSFVSYDYLRASTTQTVKHFKPHKLSMDGRRMALGGFLFQMATHFIAFHEQGHFFRGHLHYLASTSTSISFRELPSGGRRREGPPEITRALELDADAFAAGVAFGDIAGFRDIHEPARVATDAVQSTDDYLRLALVSVACVFGVLTRNDHQTSPSVATHPSAPSRLLNIWLVFVLCCRRELRRTMELDDPLLTKAIRDINVVFGLLGAPKLKASHLEALAQGLYPDDPDEVIRELRVNREKLASLQKFLSSFADELINTLIRSRTQK